MKVEAPKFQELDPLGKPQHEVTCAIEGGGRLPSCCSVSDLTDKIAVAKHFVQECSNTVHILIADLHEDGTGIREQITGYCQAVAKVDEAIRTIIKNPKIAVMLS